MVRVFDAGVRTLARVEAEGPGTGTVLYRNY